MDLFQHLRQVARNGSAIKLLNVYKGLPISYEAQISSIGDLEIQVRSNRYQIACLYYQHETYIQSDELPFVLRSQVVNLHLGRETATLTNFEAAAKNIGNRTQIRVEPGEPLVALIQFHGAPIGLAAPITDISAEGASFYLEPYLFSSRLCRPGNQLSVRITLPDNLSQRAKKTIIKNPRDNRSIYASQPDASIGSEGTVTISTTGQVTWVRSELIHYRVGVRLLFKDLSRTIILQYISQRQSEIIRDLTRLSDELYSRKK